MQGLISVVQAAERLGVSRIRVLQLISEGRLPASKVGQAYVINEGDLALIADRKPGRPKKTDDQVTGVPMEYPLEAAEQMKRPRARKSETIEASRKSAPVKAAKKRTAKKVK